MCRFNCLLSFVVLINITLNQCFVEGNLRTIKSCNEFKLANGRMRIKPKGRLAKFQCNRGYLLAGEKYSYCVKGSFDVPPPVCVKSTCPKIKQLTNGIILPSYNGGVANFYCKPGFTVRGATISYCDGSRWSHNLPACISTHMPTPTSCDFETEDLCGWSHDLNHDFDWRRQNFQTPSGHIGTGPKNDHTKGMNKDGYYVYIESTSRLENDTARLVSPIYRAQHNGVCFTFWYHMFGRDMGQLRVYLRRETEQLKTLRPIWTEQGNHGDVWRRGRIDIEEGVQDDFQIIIEGVRGKSYVSDIAVDDVVLTESCPEDEEEMYGSSSTTESSTDDDLDVFFGSCANRCNDNNTEIILGDSGSCECNESCYERNTCCPDYTIVCLIAGLEETTTEDIETYTPTETTETEMPVTTKIVTKKSVVPTTNTPETVVTKQDTTTVVISSTISTTYKSVANTINTKDTTTQQSEVSTTTSTPVTTKATTTNPPKTTTPKPTKTTPTSNKNNNNIDKQTTAKTIVPKTKTTSTVTPSTVIPTQSPATTKLPTSQVVTDKTEPTILTQPTLQIETDYELTTKEMIQSKVEMVVQNVKLAKEEEESNLTLVIFSASALIVIGTVVAVVIFAKYSTKCRRIRFRNPRNNDSMSDVRFLASDEVLDFTWRSSDM